MCTDKLEPVSKGLQKEQNFRFDDEGIHAHSENGSGKVAWKDLLKWKERKEALLIYPASNLFYIIPKSIFQNEAELFSIRVSRLKSCEKSRN